MRSALTLFLEGDTVDHIDWIAKQLARQRNVEMVSRSDAVAWLALRHWKKIMRQQAMKKPLAKNPPLVLR